MPAVGALAIRENARGLRAGRRLSPAADVSVDGPV